MDSTYLTEACKEDQKVNALFTFLNARLSIPAPGQACITLPVSPGLIQGGGVVAGGILATLADEAMAHAVMSMPDNEHPTVTAEMNIRYLRSGGPERDGLLTAVGRVIKSGSALCTAEADVLDEHSRLLARAGATFYIVQKHDNNYSK
ncbi:MAG: PaaI family thioesterase [Desulfovibrio sp.]|jgi:uncharacterized protein (TIGR00369 family)|nr:PaaI family thioesterase [Desulfovibrio sp.]